MDTAPYTDDFRVDIVDAFHVRKPFEAPAQPVAAFCIVANEMYFLPHLLAHYRALGVREFHFLVDRSDDGTLEYLLQQTDCAVLCSRHRFGDWVDTRARGRQLRRRFADVCRSLAGQRLLLGRWGLIVDADEFLVLPEGFTSLPDLVAALDAHGLDSCRAPMVDFFPAYLSDLDGADTQMHPLQHAPLFDRIDYDWPAGRPRPARLAHEQAVRSRLNQALIDHDPSLAGPLADGFVRMLHKVPLLRWHAGTAMSDAHTCNHLPSDAVQVALAHFKFAPGWLNKVSDALTRRQYARASTKYEPLALAAERLRSLPLAGPCTQRAQKLQDLAGAGLAWWRLPLPGQPKD